MVRLVGDQRRQVDQAWQSDGISYSISVSSSESNLATNTVWGLVKKIERNLMVIEALRIFHGASVGVSGKRRKFIPLERTSPSLHGKREFATKVHSASTRITQTSSWEISLLLDWHPKCFALSWSGKIDADWPKPAITLFFYLAITAKIKSEIWSKLKKQTAVINILNLHSFH